MRPAKRRSRSARPTGCRRPTRPRHGRRPPHRRGEQREAVAHLVRGARAPRAARTTRASSRNSRADGQPAEPRRGAGTTALARDHRRVGGPAARARGARRRRSATTSRCCWRTRTSGQREMVAEFEHPVEGRTSVLGLADEDVAAPPARGHRSAAARPAHRRGARRNCSSPAKHRRPADRVQRQSPARRPTGSADHARQPRPSQRVHLGDVRRADAPATTGMRDDPCGSGRDPRGDAGRTGSPPAPTSASSLDFHTGQDGVDYERRVGEVLGRWLRSACRSSPSSKARPWAPGSVARRDVRHGGGRAPALASAPRSPARSGTAVPAAVVGATARESRPGLGATPCC